MDSYYLLPATTYECPSRQARKHKLNTIIEDEYSDDEEAKYAAEEMGKAEHLRILETNIARSVGSTSPVPSLTSSISSYYRSRQRSRDFDDLYDISDDDSQDDHDITPGMFPRVGSERSTSPESTHSLKKDKRRVPSLIIPSPGHWPIIQKLKDGSPPLPPKIPISPAVLSLLPHDGRSMSSQAPSLDGSLFSDLLAASSAPVTPDLQVHSEGEDVWGQPQEKNKSYSASKNPRVAGSTTSEVQIADDASPCWSVDDFENGMIIRDFGFGEDRPAPDSPILGSEDGFSERGVQLSPEALDTLQHLSLEIPAREDIILEPETVGEMQEVQRRPSRPSSADFTPMSHISEYSISGLSIPSPGGFFASLNSNARHTWCHPGSSQSFQPPPSSTTAEQFYNCPWNRDPQATVERVIEFDDADTEGPPTAKQLPLNTVKGEQAKSYFDNSPELAAHVDSPKDYDEDYEKAIQLVAENSLDRTSVWLAHQTSYMAALREANPINEIGLAISPSRRASQHFRNDSLGSPMKKAVKFLESETAKCRSPKFAKVKSESLYYHAFQHIMKDIRQLDAFRHRYTRTDAIQAGRIATPHEHIELLQGNFYITESDRPVPLRPVSMFPGTEQDANEQTTEQKVIAQVERERQALDQVNTVFWVIEAYKYINGGGLLNSPAVNLLKCAPSQTSDPLMSSSDYVRILDLGGQPNCDWAWHCAFEYTNAKIHTANTEANLSSINASIRGPSNHRLNVVSNLYTLPYPDAHFMAISARSVFAHLKTVVPQDLHSPAEMIDEYDLCLRECLRLLKPGGYLEFSLLDSEIVHAGPLATALSVEFGFNLKTRGYDPSPTKNFLGRLRRAGFEDIKRAWTFLPMGAPTKDAYVPPETPPPNVSTYDLSIGRGDIEAVQGPVGSTADAANMAGLVGSWTWEQWMLKLQIEMGREGESLLEGVPAMLEEGRAMGAGWRCLSGWARKRA